MKRVTADSNILISAFLSGGKPLKLLSKDRTVRVLHPRALDQEDEEQVLLRVDPGLPRLRSLERSYEVAGRARLDDDLAELFFAL